VIAAGSCDDVAVRGDLAGEAGDGAGHWAAESVSGSWEGDVRAVNEIFGFPSKV
jgi:hypothetical protein